MQNSAKYAENSSTPCHFTLDTHVNVAGSMNCVQYYILDYVHV